VELNMYRVATTLCEIAEKEGTAPSEPGIHLFEKLFLKSVEKYGRARDLKVVMEYNLRTMNPFKDMAKGMKLVRKGAISPWDLLKRGKKDKTASGIFTKVRQAEKGEVGK
jgi:heterodisulfide reductase subunit C